LGNFLGLSYLIISSCYFSLSVSSSLFCVAFIPRECVQRDSDFGQERDHAELGKERKRAFGEKAFSKRVAGGTLG
jgi:hypothetical protein